MNQRKKLKDTISVPFRVLQTTTLAAGLGTIVLSPSSGFSPRLQSVGDNYQLYRVKNLRFRLPYQGAANSCAVGFVPDFVDTPPSTIALVGELMHRVYWPSGQTVPTEWQPVGQEDLHGALPWYKCMGGSPTSWEEQVGCLYIVGTGTQQVITEIEGTYEFKGSLDAANTPMDRRREQQLLREKQRLVSLLAYSPGKTPDSSSPQKGK